MTRLTDLIRGQSSPEDVSPDTKSSIRSIGPTGLPIPSPMCSPSIAEIDWYQCAYQELQEIKRAVQTRQPWAVDELARIASGVVASLRAHDTLVQTVLQSNAGDYPVSNAENVAIVSVKIAEALRYESAKLEQVAFAPYLRCAHLRHDPHHRGTSGNRKSALHQGVVDCVGKDHLHHRLERALRSRQASVAMTFLMTICLGLEALALRHAGTAEALLLLVQSGLIVAMITILEWSGRRKQKPPLALCRSSRYKILHGSYR